MWLKANKLSKVSLNINGSDLDVKVGDIFEEDGFKVIAFNEYFDTQVDDIIIAESTLNGIFIKKKLGVTLSEFDDYIEKELDSLDLVLEVNENRKMGKKKKYPLGTICKYNEYFLTALTKFDDKNKAEILLKDYVNFLMNFWNEVDRLYAGKSVAVPLLGSGQTRIKDKIDISDQELLEILIWSFKISRIKFNYPAKVSIIIHSSKKDKINFFKLKELV